MSLQPERPEGPETRSAHGALGAWLGFGLGLACLGWGLRSLAYRPELLLDFALASLSGLGLLALAWPRLPELRLARLAARLSGSAGPTSSPLGADAPSISRPLGADALAAAPADPSASSNARATASEVPLQESTPLDLESPAAEPSAAGGSTRQTDRACSGPVADPLAARSIRLEAGAARLRPALMLLVLALALTLMAQVGLDRIAFTGRGQAAPAGLLALLGAGLWLGALWRAHPASPDDAPIPIRPGPTLVPSSALALFGGLSAVLLTAVLAPAWSLTADSPLALMAYGSAFDNSITPIGGTLWLLGCLAIAWGLADRPTLRAGLREATRGGVLWLRLDLGQLCLIGILVLGAWFRFHDLAGLPYEMTSDHTEKLGDIQTILDGLRPAFLPGNAGREAMEFYWIALLVKLGLPLSFTTMKLGMGLVSLATLPIVYLLGRELAGRRAGLIAALLLALAPWHIQITRIGLRIAFAPFFAALALWLCLRALRLGGRNAWLSLGLVCGLGVYGYTAFRPILLAVPLIVVAKLLHDAARAGTLRRPMRWLPPALAAHLASGLLLGLVVMAPVLRYASDWPEYFNGRSRSRLVGDGAPLDQFGPLLRQNLREQLWPNIKNALLLFNLSNDGAWFQSPPGRPAFETVGAALLILGLATALLRLWQRDWRLGAMLAVLPLTLATSILALAFPRENPSLSRASAALPVAVALAALPLSILVPALGRGFGRRGRWAALLGSCLLLAWMASGTTKRYFVEYRQGYDNSTHNTREGAEVARAFLTLGGDLEHLYYVGWPNGWDYRAVGFLLGAPTWNGLLQGSAGDWSDAAEPARFHVGDPARKLYLVGGPHAEAQRVYLRELFPDAIETFHRSAVPGKDFWSLYVPGDAAGADPESTDDG